jgi:hypothetical protein
MPAVVIEGCVSFLFYFLLCKNECIRGGPSWPLHRDHSDLFCLYVRKIDNFFVIVVTQQLVCSM